MTVSKISCVSEPVVPWACVGGDDEALEALVLNQLAAEAAAGLEEHLLFCRICQNKMQTAQQFCNDLKLALREIRGTDAQAETDCNQL